MLVFSWSYFPNKKKTFFLEIKLVFKLKYVLVNRELDGMTAKGFIHNGAEHFASMHGTAASGAA